MHKIPHPIFQSLIWESLIEVNINMNHNSFNSQGDHKNLMSPSKVIDLNMNELCQYEGDRIYDIEAPKFKSQR